MFAAGHEAILGSTTSLRPITRALISVSDKSNLEKLARLLTSFNVQILSTGGTAATLRAFAFPELKNSKAEVVDISEYTASPEILNGRVKSLHPKVHAGILAVRGNEVHEKEMVKNGLGFIDLVVVNLYPFEKVVKEKDVKFEKAVENIDIGGPAMLRASAKNFSSVVVLTDPSQYEDFEAEIKRHSGEKMQTDFEFRKKSAAKAFSHSAKYDALISNYFMKDQENASEKLVTPYVSKVYENIISLKYGCNPNQVPAAVCKVNGHDLPFEIVNGQPGYINFLDALNSWQLVRELRMQLNLPAAASFKHVSPAGAAVFVPLNKQEVLSYELKDNYLQFKEDSQDNSDISKLSIAYIRARQADPKSSFGDFIALSDKVDVATAKLIKSDISDGIIAPDYDQEALDILKAKKGGKFIVLKIDFMYDCKGNEFREVFGIGLMQKHNDCIISPKDLTTDKVLTKNKNVSDDVKRDVVLGNIVLKYTQSNSVGFAANGQMLGVGAGQQSRVDCVKIAGRKAQIWALRQFPQILALEFKKSVKKQDRINARVKIIETIFEPFQPTDEVQLSDVMDMLEIKDSQVPKIYRQEAQSFLQQLNNVTVVSDAFFPFRDNIDVCNSLGFRVSTVAQTGGSVNDESVTQACDEYGMAMIVTGQRLFHH